jgi:trigger factor
MNISKKELEKSKLEITVELSQVEFAPYIEKGAKKLSEKVKVEGFRPGKIPFDLLKQKIGEMSILEEAANIAISKTVDNIVEHESGERQPVGQPSVSITKLAPNNPLEYKITLSLLPTIEIGKYKELDIKLEEAKIEDKELERALKDLRESRVTEKIASRKIKEGDKTLIDIEMFLDKVPVEDGIHKDLPIIIGKDYFVPGFDKNLIGLEKDEVKEFSLFYPEDHHQKHLAGKNVKFKIRVKEVYERNLPELDDSFAASFHLKNMEELKKGLKDSLLQEKKRNTDLKNESEMVGKIVRNTKFGEFPEVLIESETKNLLAELEQSVVKQGGKFEDYLNHLKKTKEELMLEITPNAVKRVKAALVIREISITEKIFSSEQEIEDKIKELKEQYVGQDKILKMLEEPGYKNYLRNILTNEKVIAKLKEWNYANTGDKQKS